MGPHAVMITLPLLGHIHPLLRFAKALVAHHNFTVTFVNNHYYHHYLLAREPPSAGASSHGKLRLEWIENGLPLDFDFINIWRDSREFYRGCLNMRDPFKALIERLNQKNPSVSCVIFGSFMPGVHSVAAELDIPSVFFWSQSAAVFCIYYHIHLFAANGFFPYKKNLPGCKDEDSKLVAYIPGVPPLCPAEVPTLLHVDDTSLYTVKLMEGQSKLMRECNMVVINSFCELEREAFEALRTESLSVFAVGPLLSSMQAHNSPSELASKGTIEESLEEVQREECLRWLDKQSEHSVLYISFGTVSNPTAEAMESIALGLKESKQHFLWVIRPMPLLNIASETRREFMSIEEILPVNFVEDTKDYGLIVAWAPQQQVLGHGSIGAFLTHCGWNSIMESLSSGVPMIPLPRESDQTTNCKFVVDIWKVGMRIECKEDGTIDCAEVVRVLKVLFQEEGGQEMRRRAKMLKDSARRAGSGSSGTDMHHFAEAMRFPRLQENQVP